MLEPGTLIDKYRVHRQLGDGGMGVVYAAEHVVLQRRAAIKVLHRHVAQNPEIVRRFVNEAIGAASLNHRNIVGVHDCGQLPDGQWYIALEYLEGQSLAAFIEDHRGRPIDLPTILHILGEASNGLHAAHESNYVHRDVKPDNFFITKELDDPLRVKVLDFGIAKLNQPARGIQTLSNVVMGTPAYMAPEQLRDSKEVDRRADVFALGVIAFEMATGGRPWGETTSLYEIIAHHAKRTSPENPRRLRGDLPVLWAAAVARAMEPDPARRWQSAKELALALANATPTVYSPNGMAILEKHAIELTRASTHSLTVGRPVPGGLAAAPGPIVADAETARHRPALPATISDGVPRVGSPVTVPPPGGTAHRPISTIASSSGQAVAPPRGQRSRRNVVLLGMGIAALTGLLVVVVGAAGGAGDGDDGAGRAAAMPDAAVAPDTDAAQPAAANVTAIEPPSMADAGIVPTAAPDAGVTAKPSRDGGRRRRDRRTGQGTDAGQDADSGFKPDDVID